MYDHYIDSSEYQNLLSRINDLFYDNGDVEDAVVDKLKDDVYDAYEKGRIRANQYDHLMSLINL